MKSFMIHETEISSLLDRLGLAHYFHFQCAVRVPFSESGIH